jgi:hypothetical protein
LPVSPIQQLRHSYLILQYTLLYCIASWEVSVPLASSWAAVCEVYCQIRSSFWCSTIPNPCKLLRNAFYVRENKCVTTVVKMSLHLMSCNSCNSCSVTYWVTQTVTPPPNHVLSWVLINSFSGIVLWSILGLACTHTSLEIVGVQSDFNNLLYWRFMCPEVVASTVVTPKITTWPVSLRCSATADICGR